MSLISVACSLGELALRGRGASFRQRGPARDGPRARLGRVAPGRVHRRSRALAALALGVPLGRSSTGCSSGSSIDAAVRPRSSPRRGHRRAYSAAPLVTTAARAPGRTLASAIATVSRSLIERSAYLPMGAAGARDRARLRLLLRPLRLLRSTRAHSLLIVAYASCSCRSRWSGCARRWRTASPRSRRSAQLARLAARQRARAGHPAADRAGPRAPAVALVFLSSRDRADRDAAPAPDRHDTLATGFWSYTTSLSYGAAAPYAALMVARSPRFPRSLASRRVRSRPAERPLRP